MAVDTKNITFSAVDARTRLFKQRPDKTVTITLENGAHNWTVKNSGAFLKSETLRLVNELQSLSDTEKSADTTKDDAARTEFMDASAAAIKRYREAFNAQVSSADGSASKWLDENLQALDLDVIAVTVIELVTALQGAN